MSYNFLKVHSKRIIEKNIQCHSLARKCFSPFSPMLALPVSHWTDGALRCPRKSAKCGRKNKLRMFLRVAFRKTTVERPRGHIKVCGLISMFEDITVYVRHPHEKHMFSCVPRMDNSPLSPSRDTYGVMFLPTS